MSRKRLKKRITIDNIYYTYPYRYDASSPYYTDKKQYKAISETFYTLLNQVMVNEGIPFDLPLRLGKIHIVKFKTKKRYIDWNKTKALDGQIVFHKNAHSEGYAARWWWDCSRWLKYHSLYKVKPVRTNSRYLAQQIKENNSILKYPTN